MRQYLFKTMGLLVVMGLVTTQALAQESTRLGENEEIVIRKKGDKDTKVTVEIKQGEVKINGKPLSEFNDDNLVITRKRRSGEGRVRGYEIPTPPSPPLAPSSPFRGGTWNFEDEDFRIAFGDPNKPFLGILSEKNDHGAKITSVTKGSAAEKAGLKAGDIITAVNGIKIASPEDLSKTIATFKPDEKVTITYNAQGKKEQKVTATLGKKPGAVSPGEFDFKGFEDMDIIVPPNRDGFRYRIQDGSPKLGLRIQDTEDGKGVKVLDVDDESNAEKAGLKEDDIITEFDGVAVNSARELADAAKSAKDKSNVTIKITRDGKPQVVEVKIPKKLKTATL